MVPPEIKCLGKKLSAIIPSQQRHWNSFTSNTFLFLPFFKYYHMFILFEFLQYNITKLSSDTFRQPFFCPGFLTQQLAGCRVYTEPVQPPRFHYQCQILIWFLSIYLTVLIFFLNVIPSLRRNFLQDKFSSIVVWIRSIKRYSFLSNWFMIFFSF